MPARIESNPPRVSGSLVTALTTAFVVLSVIPLLLISSLLSYFDFQAQREVLFYQQQLTAAESAREVSGFIERIFSALEASARVGQVSDRDQQRLILEKLLGFESSLRALVLVDKARQEIASASRRSSIASSNLLDQVESDLLAQVRQEQRFISDVYIDEQTSEPLVILAVPVEDVFDEFQGALVAEINLKFMWDVVDRLQVGQTGLAYVVDKQGGLIAFSDTARVLKGENLSQLTEVAKFVRGQDVDELELYSTGINGSSVVAAYVSLGTPDWAVVTEIPVEEAYQSSIYSAALLLGSFLVIAILATGAGVYASRYLTTPLLNLTQTATRLAAGEVGLQVTVEGPAEVVRLASVFNHMTAQLRQSIDNLLTYTRRLQTLVVVGEHLTSILELNDLPPAVVRQIKDNFGYDQVSLYLLDETGQNLALAAGQTGADQIAIDSQDNPVAAAARAGQAVRFEATQPAEAPGQAYAGMALPIILEGQALGALVVQQQGQAGLDENEANLLRSLANQIVVAVRNARLFVLAEAALAEARAAQERYISQAWQRAGQRRQGGGYLYQRPGASPLAETVTTQLAGQAAVYNQSSVVEVNGGAQTGLVAPIRLQEQTIGLIQLHETDATRQHRWAERELALVQAIADQVAQTAENLRLFEETGQRADYERLVGEINQKLRQTSSMEALVKTAAEELSRALGTTHSLVKIGTLSLDSALSQGQMVEDQPAHGGQNGK
jgi:GAF domain-containing protein/HAMP domain-containing protein